MTELEQYIKVYFGISPAELAQIAALFREEQLPRGAVYLAEGAYCNKLSFISEGWVRTYAHRDGKEITQWIGGKGYFVTDLAGLMFQAPSRWQIEALTDLQLYTIDRENYERIGRLAPRWHELEKLFIAKCFTFLEERIFQFLSLDAEGRYRLFAEQQGELLNVAPLQHIASMLGMTPETFSRIRRKVLKG
jgi:CRP-like cAMP-binding protein